jgi:hypothetical protein
MPVRILHLIVMLVLAFPLVSLGAAATAQDIKLAGVAVPGHATLGGRRLPLNGAGLRTLLGFRVYVAALYLPSSTREAELILERDTPRRLQITLLRDTSTGQNLAALRDGLIENNTPAQMEAAKTEIAAFFGLIQQVDEVPAGTVIQLDYLPGAGTRVKIAGRNLGVIPGEDFNRAILRIWLGNAPIQLSLKNALLGIGGAES